MRIIIKLYQILLTIFLERKKISVSQQAINLIVQRARGVTASLNNELEKNSKLNRSNKKKIEIILNLLI